MFVTAVFMLLLLTGSELDPCACEIPSFDLAWKSSAAVFSGRLIKAEPQVEGKQQMRFELTGSWKGPRTTPQVIVYENPSSCATTVFVVGKEYLLYAQGDKPLRISHCSRSKPMSDASEDLLLLKQEQLTGEARRDPFTSMQGDTISTSRVTKRVPRTLTVNFAVIVAISRKGTRYFAVIKGSDGKTYTMNEGDPLYDGTIERIGPNSVTFLQKSGTRSHRVTKKLHPFPE